MSTPSDEGAFSVLFSFPNPIGGAGIGLVAWNEVQELAALGVKLTVYCTSVVRPFHPSVQVHTTFSRGRRKFPRRLIGMTRSYAVHDWIVARRIRRDPGAFDVVHVWPPGCLRTLEACREVGIPDFREVPNAHTTQTFEAAARASEVAVSPLRKGQSGYHDEEHLSRELREFRLATKLLVPSDHVADSFLSRGHVESQLARHHYGFEPTRFFPAPARDPERPFTAIFVGRVEPLKGLHLVLDAWRRAGLGERARLLVLGAVMPTYLDHLNRTYPDVQPEYVGFTDDVPGLMRQADVLVFPTYTEGSALVTYEAMASGVVPLVSEAAGAHVRHGTDGLVHEVEDVDTLAEQLRSLADDPARLRELSAAAVAASSELTWAGAARRLVELYRAAVQPSGGAKRD